MMGNLRSRTTALVTGAALTCLVASTAAAGQENFRPYAAGLIDRLVVGTETLAEAVGDQDLEQAKAAWIHARDGWERGETFLGEFFPKYDARIDSWPDAENGFHAIEPILFERGDVAAARPLTDKLLESVHGLRETFQKSDLSDQGLLNGTAGIVFEIGSEKASGGESPFSDTSLRDMQNDMVGVETAYALAFAPELRDANPELHRRITAQMIALSAALDVEQIDSLDQAHVAGLSEQLALSFQDAAGALGLEAPEIGG